MSRAKGLSHHSGGDRVWYECSGDRANVISPTGHDLSFLLPHRFQRGIDNLLDTLLALDLERPLDSRRFEKIGPGRAGTKGHDMNTKGSVLFRNSFGK